MAGTYEVLIEELAEEQFRQIVDYISRVLGAPLNAEKWARLVSGATEKLTELPAWGATKLSQKDFYRKRVGKYYMYFYVDKSRRVVRITSFIFQRRGQANQLLD